MSRQEPTDSSDDRRPPDSDTANSARSDSESRTRLEPWKRNAPWLVPCIIALLVFLFGDNVTTRFDPSEAPGDGDQDPNLLGPNGEGRVHAAYSFKQAPFVHPDIVGDLVGSLADAGDQVVAVNLLDSQDSNRYLREILVTPQTNPLVPSWPWVYTLAGERYAAAPPGSFWGQELYAYRYVGATRSGLDVLHHKYSGGGSGVFNYLLFVRIEADYGVDYKPSPASGGGQRAVGPEFRQRELICFVGTISLGDRWLGTIDVVGNDVVVRGRHVYERCETGGVNTMEAVELHYFMDMDCNEGEPDNPPPAQVYKAPVWQ